MANNTDSHTQTSPSVQSDLAPGSVPSPSEWMFLQPAILDQMHDSIITTDLHGTVTGCNRATTSIYGYTSEELIGKNVAILYPEEDFQLFHEKVLPAIHARGEFAGELRNRTRTGEIIYIHLSATLLRDSEGAPVGMVGSSVDITAQKLAGLSSGPGDEFKRVLESALQQTAETNLLATVVERAQDAILITEAEPIDEPGPRILYVNAAFEELSGYKRAEILGKTPRILQGPNTDRAALRRIRQALENWSPAREELINYRKDGTEFTVELSIFPLSDENGRFTHWVAMQRNVTEQHTLREQLRDEARLHYLTESIPQLLWTADNEGRCQFASESFAAFVGASQKEFLGRGWVQFVHPEDQKKTLQLWMESIQSGKPYSTEIRLRRHDGEFIWFLQMAIPRREENGTITEWIGTSTDVSKQKLSEEVIRKTEKLAVVGRLASSIAHEMNNPLSSVTNLLYLLSMQTCLDKTSQEYLRSAQEELARVSEISSQTLRFHKQSSAAAPTRISEVVDSVLAFYRPRLMRTGIQVLREYVRTEQLTCYASEIRHAVSNVIGNAIEALSKGGRLRVRIRPSVNWKLRNRGVRITIADTGSGISREHIDRIFEPFFTTREETGTGLGLWITRDLIAKHDGAIRMRSSTRPGHSGTVCTILLPFEPRAHR